jgi:hypothetical protein
VRARRKTIAALAVAAIGWSASALAQPSPPPVAPAPVGVTGSQAAPAPTPAPPAPTPAAAPTDVAAPAAAPGNEQVAPIPTADATPAPSDHDAVVGHIGVEVRRFDPGPMPLSLRPGFGCPAASAGMAECQVAMGALSVRYWRTRNLAFNAGLAFAAGGGRDATVSRDTHLGLGPILGLSVLLANWRHLAVSATPTIAYVWFNPSLGDDGSTTVLALHGALEAELHFGFVGVPALSVGLLAGMAFQYESVAETRIWSVGVLGGNSVWGALSNVFVRYYL